jgi:hypothetical protein
VFLKCFKLSDVKIKSTQTKFASQDGSLPSPKPKQGIRLSSSKGDRVWPTILIACSYGFGSVPIACKLRLLNETFPAKPQQLQIGHKKTVTNSHQS